MIVCFRLVSLGLILLVLIDLDDLLDMSRQLSLIIGDEILKFVFSLIGLILQSLNDFGLHFVGHWIRFDISFSLFGRRDDRRLRDVLIQLLVD